MAQIILQFGRGGAPSQAGGVSQVFDANPQTEEITSSGTSAASTMAAKTGDVARITSCDDAQLVWVTFAATPVAVAGAGHPINPRATIDIGPIGTGHKMAVINDS